MPKRKILREIALRGLSAAEESIDRFRYDLLGAKTDAEPKIEVYCGFRNAERLWLQGRVLEKWKGQMPVGDATLSRVRNMLRLYESDELPGVELTIETGGRTEHVVSDDEGYFCLELSDLARTLPEVTKFEDVSVKAPGLSAPPVSGEVLAPGRNVRLGIISDIDDTIIETGATNFVKNWRRILVETPKERVAVPGAPELYRMLTGLDGSAPNPIFYVSSSPWNLYPYLQEFLRHQGLPRGPMFLRDYGIDDLKFIARPHTQHKTASVERVLDFYPDMRFLLIGDDGQKDITVYADAARRFPERIAGVFIRDVHGDEHTDETDPELKVLEAAGIPVYFGKTLEGAADVAREMGFGV
ncbi:MAG: phosphatase domain-containing protein [Parvularcula sp.]|jgi:phosphatidate phosphatase APP1|nr:phosphatase domain-containing protein [Parvularcula sp.]